MAANAVSRRSVIGAALSGLAATGAASVLAGAPAVTTVTGKETARLLVAEAEMAVAFHTFVEALDALPPERATFYRAMMRAVMVAAPTSDVPPLPQAVVINTDKLAAMGRRISDEYHEMWDRAERIYGQLAGMLTPEQVELLRQYSDRSNDAATIQQDFIVTEIARHLPGVSPVINMLHDHVSTVSYQKPGICCTVAEGFEP